MLTIIKNQPYNATYGTGLKASFNDKYMSMACSPTHK